MFYRQFHICDLFRRKEKERKDKEREREWERETQQQQSIFHLELEKWGSCLLSLYLCSHYLTLSLPLSFFFLFPFIFTTRRVFPLFLSLSFEEYITVNFLSDLFFRKKRLKREQFCFKLKTFEASRHYLRKKKLSVCFSAE